MPARTQSRLCVESVFTGPHESRDLADCAELEKLAELTEAAADSGILLEMFERHTALQNVLEATVYSQKYSHKVPDSVNEETEESPPRL